VCISSANKPPHRADVIHGDDEIIITLGIQFARITVSIEGKLTIVFPINRVLVLQDFNMILSSIKFGN
jgi:hypothetical protein